MDTPYSMFSSIVGLTTTAIPLALLSSYLDLGMNGILVGELLGSLVTVSMITLRWKQSISQAVSKQEYTQPTSLPYKLWNKSFSFFKQKASDTYDCIKRKTQSYLPDTMPLMKKI
jgi:hypothetical protein